MNVKHLNLAIIGAVVVACSIPMFRDDPKQLVLVRSYVSTNLVSAGYVGSSSPPPRITPDGWIEQGMAMNADAVQHPPVWRVVTNYVLGFKDGSRVVEVFTATR